MSDRLKKMKKIAKGLKLGEMTEELKMSAKRLAVLMTNAVLLVLIGLWTVIPGVSAFFGSFHWIVPLLATLWGAYTLGLGLSILVTVVTMIASGEGAFALKLITSKFVRKYIKFITGKGIFINMSLLLLLMIFSALASAFNIVIIELTCLIFTGILYIASEPIRSWIKHSIEGVFPEL